MAFAPRSSESTTSFKPLDLRLLPLHVVPELEQVRGSVLAPLNREVEREGESRHRRPPRRGHSG